jgi:hypothetical protein
MANQKLWRLKLNQPSPKCVNLFVTQGTAWTLSLKQYTATAEELERNQVRVKQRGCV